MEIDEKENKQTTLSRARCTQQTMCLYFYRNLNAKYLRCRTSQNNNNISRMRNEIEHRSRSPAAKRDDSLTSSILKSDTYANGIYRTFGLHTHTRTRTI